MSEKTEQTKTSYLDGIKAHPWITGIFVFCVFLWIGIAFTFLPGDWGMFRKVAAGIIWGSFCAAIVTATKTVGE
jgi:hypothetical protein